MIVTSAEFQDHRHSCICSVDIGRDWEEFHIMGPWSGSLGVSSILRHIGERGCLGHLVFKIDRLAVCTYLIFLYLGAWTYDPVTGPRRMQKTSISSERI